MYCKVLSGTVYGVEGLDIGVEVDVSPGLPVFEMVGYLGSEVKESRERVRTALKNSGFALPAKRITVNLSPADIHKEGAAFDLAIALAILSAIGLIPQEQLNGCIVLGELGLDGSVRPVNGVLSMVSHSVNSGVSWAIVPKANAKEGAVVTALDVYGVSSLRETVEFLLAKTEGETTIEKEQIDLNSVFKHQAVADSDFETVYGQRFVKRALEIAASGFHNILLVGPPGAGKSMLAKCMPSILPSLNLQESIDITKIYSVKGLLEKDQALVTTRPFRAPHHTVSMTALTGGGRKPMPGEISLAHNGVLFLDELPEFKRDVIEVMRQPLEDRVIRVSRVYAAYSFPADFMLVAAMNPCPCGYFPNRQKCHCTLPQIQRYLSKISQPMLDRMDLCVETKAVSYEQLKSQRKEEQSKDIRKRVERALAIQKERYKKEEILFNSQLSVGQIATYCKLAPDVESVLKDAMQQYELSARAYHRILRVARTIADMDRSIEIEEAHIMEALVYHNGGMKFFQAEEVIGYDG